jgi:hypothetical protein
MDHEIRQLVRAWQSSGSEDDLRKLITVYKRIGVRGLQLSGFLPGPERLSVDVMQGYPEDIYQFFWPSVTYKGKSLLDLMFDFEGRVSPMVQGLAEDGQEVFLGWWPSEGYFIMGWDMESSEGESYAAVFSFDHPHDQHPGLVGLHAYHTRHDLFYPGMLEELRIRYPGMIGLRYD